MVVGILSCALAGLVTVTPVMAACRPAAPAFAPGDWLGWVAEVTTVDRDDDSVAYSYGYGGFDFTVLTSGGVTGEFRFAADVAAKNAFGVEGKAIAFARGPITGTSAVLLVTGITTLDMRGLVTMSSGSGPDPLRPDTIQIPTEGILEFPFGTELSPSNANCYSASGTMTAPIGYGGPDVGWYAYREGGASRSDPRVAQQLNELLREAQAATRMDPFDAVRLEGLVFRLLDFDALLSSLETCNPAGVGISSTWAMLRGAVTYLVRVFVDEAAHGSYPTSDVIHVMTVYLLGGSTAWHGNECSEAEWDAQALALVNQFENVLLSRLVLAQDREDTAEIRQIAAAAYQFGLSRVIAALGEAAQ